MGSETILEVLAPDTPVAPRRKIALKWELLMGGMALAGIMVCADLSVIYRPILGQPKDERGLTQLAQLAQTDARAKTDPVALVRSVVSYEYLRSGGHVSLVQDGVHTNLVIDHGEARACKMFVQEGYIPVNMTTPKVSINGVEHALPGDPVSLCPPEREDMDARTNLVMSWRIN